MDLQNKHNEKVLLRISYMGKNYCGFQYQPNCITIQEKLNDAANVVFGVKCNITGCSRTDSGVHANEFFALVTPCNKAEKMNYIPANKIPVAMCIYLPNDITVYEAFYVNENFHPRFDAQQKEYLYRIWNRPEKNPFLDGLIHIFPKKISDQQLQAMNLAASHFCGEHDFYGFMSAGSSVSETVRTIYSAKLVREGDEIKFYLSGNGFLYNMVRIIVGTLLKVAMGKILPEEIPDIIKSKNRKRAGFTAPPEGLYLNKVKYDNKYFKN